jgi:hypothetical protein
MTVHKYRDLESRVERPMAIALKAVATRLPPLKVEGRASRVYINEIVDAISQGLLLASITLSMTLLEIWVRDLLVVTLSKQQNPQTDHELEMLVSKIDRELEGVKRGVGFAEMCKKLVVLSAIRAEEEAGLLDIYRFTRNPLQHGITGRQVDPEGQHLSDLSETPSRANALLARVFGYAPHARADSFEDFVYDNALRLLTGVADFLEAHPLPPIKARL